MLRREGLSKLADLQPVPQGEEAPKKTFKDYEPGYLHIDIKYLPKMPDESARRYLYVAIDRATRWVFLRTYRDQTERSSVDFLRRVHKATPFKITKLLTDNGTQFTDRFTSKDKQPTGKHVFDKQCQELNIEHRLAPARHPQTNGTTIKRSICRWPAWLSASMAASVRLSNKPGSPRVPNSMRL